MMLEDRTTESRVGSIHSSLTICSSFSHVCVCLCVRVDCDTWLDVSCVFHPQSKCLLLYSETIYTTIFIMDLLNVPYRSITLCLCENVSLSVTAL